MVKEEWKISQIKNQSQWHCNTDYTFLFVLKFKELSTCFTHEKYFVEGI